MYIYICVCVCVSLRAANRTPACVCGARLQFCVFSKYFGLYIRIYIAHRVRRQFLVAMPGCDARTSASCPKPCAILFACAPDVRRKTTKNRSHTQTHNRSKEGVQRDYGRFGLNF